MGPGITPFQVRNLSPTALVHGLSIAETPHLLRAGETSLYASYDLVNNSSPSSSANEGILLDGETYVATLRLRYGLSEQLQVGIDLPRVWHPKGAMDCFSGDWHELFILPNGSRDDLQNDQLNYLCAGDGGERLRLQFETDGLGDLCLQLAWQFKTTEQSACALLAQVKAPTGDANKLTGSEAWGLSLALSSQRDFTLGKGRGALWSCLGVSWLASS